MSRRSRFVFLGLCSVLIACEADQGLAPPEGTQESSTLSSLAAANTWATVHQLPAVPCRWTQPFPDLWRGGRLPAGGRGAAGELQVHHDHDIPQGNGGGSTRSRSRARKPGCGARLGRKP